jgi:N-acetyl-anhydromuramyl-L-alanine amidase AmpD
LAGAVSTLRQKGFSYHYLIEDGRNGHDGLIIKCCPAGNVAYHAGKSHGPDGVNVNLYSIGVSFINTNTGRDPYSPLQFESARELILALVDAYPSIKWLTTHYWVSPGRKFDPRGFDVMRLAKEVGIEVWDGGRPPLK